MAMDLYELLMAQGYWRLGWGGRTAVFNLFFRKNPFGNGFVLACGQESVRAFLEDMRFSEQDLEYPAIVRGSDGRPLFHPDFLTALADFSFRCDVLAAPEGSVVFPDEPIVQVQGPLLQAQLIETALLTSMGFPSLVATKAARVCRAAEGDPVIEFGLRRAQGWQAGLIASRSAFIGGCVGTSNVAAGQAFGIPVRGTMAHSWVMAFHDEVEAFAAYGHAAPNNCIFVLDTYDSEKGIQQALRAAETLRREGIVLQAVRLDSGNLAQLSRVARRSLDQAGLAATAVFVSGDLDEYRIRKWKAEGACVDGWGVGTRLVTAFEEPALAVVYKLSAITDENGNLQDRVKISNDRGKRSLPGVPRVVRFYRDARAVCDVIYDHRDGVPSAEEIGRSWKPDVRLRETLLAGDCRGEGLLLPLFEQGRPVGEPQPLTEVRKYAQNQIASLPEEVCRLERAARYPVLETRGVRRRRRQATAGLRRSR